MQRKSLYDVRVLEIEENVIMSGIPIEIVGIFRL